MQNDPSFNESRVEIDNSFQKDFRLSIAPIFGEDQSVYQ